LVDEYSHLEENERRFWEWRPWVKSDVVPAFGNCVIPIYKHKASTLFSERTGFLLQIANRHFLLTASHDLQEFLDNGFRPMTSPNIPNDPPVGFGIAAVFGTQVDDTSTDIAIFELTDESADYFRTGWRRFLRLPELCFDKSLDRAFHLLIGYPTPEVRNVGMIGDIPQTVAQRFWYITNDFPHDPKKLEPHDPNNQFALEYGRTSINEDGDEFKSLHLGGMSGCPVFRISPCELLSKNLNYVKCVGIQCSFKPNTYVKGSYITHAVDMIYEKYPDLRSAIELSKLPG
jgi:hypothetical protein